MANSVLAKMAVQISANTAEFNKALQSTSNNLKSFTSGIQNIAAQVGVAFGVQQVLQFGLEVSKLAGQAEAVQTAFDRLPNSIRLMERLKDATGGTVSELELMKRAVQASNFDISLEALPRLLEFATLRAQQTGQSVDYLVDSIVTGIGRKSKLILDNLGISAVQLSEELKGVSLDASSIGEVADAVGRIAEKNLANMAKFSENAATKLQRLAASWENLKVAIGNSANGTGAFGAAIDTLGNTIDVFASDNISKFQKIQTALVASLNPRHLSEFTKALKESEQAIIELQKKQESFGQLKINQVAQSLINQFNGVSEAINVLTNKIPENQEALLKAGITFDNFDKVLATLNRRLSENQSMDSAIDTIAEMEDAIKALNEEIGNTNELDIKSIRTNQQLIKSYQERIDKLKGVIKANKELRESDLDRARLMQMLQSSNKDVMSTFNPTNLDENIIPDLEIESDEPEDIFPTFDIEKYLELKSEIESINESISQSFLSLGEDILFAFGAGAGDKNLGKGLLASLARFGSMYGKQLIALGVAKKAEGIVTNNPVAISKGVSAIVAGAALVAGSAVLGGVASSMGSGSSAGSGGSGVSSSSTRLATNAAQNEFSYETVIRGQDLYVILSNYQKNRNRTSAIGG